MGALTLKDTDFGRTHITDHVWTESEILIHLFPCDHTPLISKLNRQAIHHCALTADFLFTLPTQKTDFTFLVNLVNFLEIIWQLDRHQ